MDQPNPKTFCPAPWFQVRNSNDMTKRVCGSIKTQPEDRFSVGQSPLEYLNSDHIQRLKKQLHNGSQATACDACWKNEDSGAESLRQKLINQVTSQKGISNSFINNYFKHKNNYHSDLLIMADIKIGNTCNHACVMCHPGDSSLIYNKWLQGKKQFFVKEKLEQDSKYFDKIKLNTYKNDKYRSFVSDILNNNQNLRNIKLLGGEPLLDSRLLEKLSHLPAAQKNKISLEFITNGSIDLSRVLNKLGDFRKINFSISIEGVGKTQEYARMGSDWSFLENNILQVRDTPGVSVGVVHTLQTSTVLGFVELANWIADNNLKLSFGCVTEPDFLSFKSMPELAKDKAIASLESSSFECIQNDFQNNNLITKEQVLKFIRSFEFDQSMHSRFKTYVNWYEQDSKIKLKDLYPELL